MGFLYDLGARFAFGIGVGMCLFAFNGSIAGVNLIGSLPLAVAGLVGMWRGGSRQ